MNINRFLAVLLAGTLQILPMLRAVIPLEARGLAPSTWAWVLKLGGGALAFMGSYDAASGATQIVAPYTVNAKVGTAYSRQLTTSGQTAHSWSASTAAKGTAVFPLTPGLWLTNSNGKIGGTPTWAGTSNITINAWESTGNGGASVSAAFVFTITNSATGPVAPAITTQPQSQTNYVNTSASFSVAVSGTAPLSYQWRFQGNPVANATTNSYTLGSVQTGDAGSYSVIVTNAGGAVTSGVAVLTVLIPSADLVAGITGPATVAPGASMACVVSVTNLGPSTASNVVLSDALPAGVSFVSATGGGVAGSGVVSWPAIASLPSGSGTSFTLTLTALISGSFTNIVSATSSTSDPNAANNNGSAVGSQLNTTVTPQADLAVLNSGPASAVAGGTLSYTITLTNSGPSVASNVVATDNLPSGATFVSATGSGTVSAGTVTWPAIASFASGASASYTVTVTAPASGTLTNRASCTSSTLDPVAGNNNGTAAASSAITSVQLQADLAVFASGAAVILPGSNLTYTITVTNLGPSTAASVIVADTMPTGATFVSATGGGVASAGTVTWPAIASLTSGSAASFSLTVAAPSSGNLTNSASCTSSTTDPVAANNNGSGLAAKVISTVQAQADLAVLTTGPAGVLPGSNLTYTVIVTNMGPSAAASVVVADVLPAAATFVSATGSGVRSGNVLTWPAIASLSSGAAASFSVTVTAPAAGTLTNSASCTASSLDPVSANNNGTAAAASVITTVGQEADLTILLAGASAVLPGSNLTYTVSVTNLGPSAATNVIVTDTLPAGVTFVSATGAGTLNSGVVSWPAIAALPSGAGLSFNLVVKAPVSGPLTNVASATSGTPDPNASNNNGTGSASRLVTSITPQADLVVVTTGPATVNAGATVNYTVTVTNLGVSTATGVVVADVLPLGAAFVSASAGGVASASTVTWPAIATLNSGVAASFTVTVTAPASGTLTNRASGTSAALDPVAGNNDGTAPAAAVVTTVQPQANVAVFSSGPASVTAGTAFSYTITVTNIGPSTAASVVVTDTLPAGSTLVSASGGGVASAGTITWPAIASLASGAAATFTLTVSSPLIGTLTNLVAGTAATADPVAANNSASSITASVANQPPTLGSLANLTLAENAGLQTVSLSGISSGSAGEVQTLAVTAVSSNPSLLPNPAVSYSSPNATGSLSYTPVAATSGSATITVTVNDGGTTNSVATRSFLVTVVHFDPRTACTNTLTLSSAAFAANAGSGIFSVANGSNCTWSIVAPDWISLSSTNGTGDYTGTFTADANTGLSRTGLVSVVGGATDVSCTVTQQAIVPGAVALITPPNGAIVKGRRPQFTWSQPGSAGAWYHLYIACNGAGYLDLWIQGETNWTSTADMPGANYTWWVQPWSPAGLGPWSEASSFTIPLNVPTAVTLLAPAGNIASASTQRYVCKADSAAVWYELYITKDGQLFSDRWVNVTNSAVDIATGNIAVDVSGHAPGSYQWWVRGWSPDGIGPWSNVGSFSIGSVTLLAPANGAVLQVRRPQLAWSQADPVATWFHLYVTRNGSAYLDQWIQGTTNWTASTDMPGGDYTWYVLPWSPAGAGSWSGAGTFSIQSAVPGTITQLSPAVSVPASSLQRYTWRADSAANLYELYILRNGQLFYDQWIASTNSVVDISTGNFAVDVTGHSPGTYQWWARAWSPDGMGAWSAGLTFLAP